MKVDNIPARGMRDLLPEEVATRDHVLSTITQVYRNFGYRRIEATPSRTLPAYKADRAAWTKDSLTRSGGPSTPYPSARARPRTAAAGGVTTLSQS